MSTLTVGIYVFPGVEVLGFAGPYEVFTTASRVHSRHEPDTPPPFEVFTIAQDNQPIKARAGLAVLADYTIAAHPALDLMIIPGGVVSEELAKPAIINWIAATASETQINASICTGAFLLAKAGLLNNKRVTTHWEDIADLRRDFPALQVIDSGRWVDEGKIVTSGGISAGIDMSRHLVERLAGQELALRTARQMDYRWEENG